MKAANILLAATLTSLPTLAQAAAQPSNAPKEDDRSIKTFYFTHAAGSHDENEILTALRNMQSPTLRIYWVPSQNAITVRGTQAELAESQKLLADLDRPRRNYRITYTVTESDAGKRIGVQHFALVVAAGNKGQLKQGSKVPVVTGSYNPGTSAAQSQFTYLDVGINIDASVEEFADGAHLSTKLEQSGVGETTASSQDPVIRQAILESSSSVTLGKPLALGAVDIPGSTRHLDIEVVLDLAH